MLPFRGHIFASPVYLNFQLFVLFEQSKNADQLEDYSELFGLGQQFFSRRLLQWLGKGIDHKVLTHS